MKRMSISSEEYVVFDVETNGLKSKEDDLLSISFYKPDDDKEYNKYLPLELNNKIVTTYINGITEKDLAGAKALTQAEFDNIVSEFELDKRTILFYAGRDFDKNFLSAYMKRHKIAGFEKLKFYNFKRNIVSSRFSTGNISKDKMCSMFKIDGVESVHSGANDCKLEWKLFEKMSGYFYLVTQGDREDVVFRLNENYIVPVSLLYSYPNMSQVLDTRPYIACQSKLVKTFEINAKGIEKFSTNFTGMTIEHLINSMLKAEEQDSQEFLIKNKRKLDVVGRIPNMVITVPMEFNPDGTVTAVQEEDKQIERQLNRTIKRLKKQIQPLVDFIREEIFKDEKILSQELVVDSINNILALCDLSSKNSILEIKTNSKKPIEYKEQLFYEARGRKVYYMQMDWGIESDKNSDIEICLPEKIAFNIFSVDVCASTPECANWYEGKRKQANLLTANKIESHLLDSDVAMVTFINKSTPIRVKCKKCDYEWGIKYDTLMKKVPVCPRCRKSIKEQTEVDEIEKKSTTPESANRHEMKREQKILMTKNMIESHLADSDVTIVSFINKMIPIRVKCKKCDYEWEIKYETLMRETPACPKCWKNMNEQIKADEIRKKETKSTNGKNESRANFFHETILQKSNNKIDANNFTRINGKVDAECKTCGYKWKVIANDLLTDCSCPECNKNKQ